MKGRSVREQKQWNRQNCLSPSKREFHESARKNKKQFDRGQKSPAKHFFFTNTFYNQCHKLSLNPNKDFSMCDTSYI